MGILKLTQHVQNPYELLEFLAVSLSARHDSEALQNLSPRTMHWDHEIEIIDMRACRAFWLHAAKQKAVEVSTLITREIEALFIKDKAKDFVIAAASTPGEALLLLKAAEEKGFQGTIHAESRLGKNLLKGLSWNVWWELCEEYAEKKNLLPAVVTKAKHSMGLAMQRIGCQKPEQLRNLPSTHLQRRFGKLVSEVWQLSFPERQGLPIDEAISLFPWTRFEALKRTFIKRHLDHELRDWQCIEELLQEDLNRLCALGSFKNDERILKLEWRIVLCNLQEIPIFIFFRHPHSLHADRPSQRTALLQINYMFEKNPVIKAASQENGLISWHLEVVEKAPARMRQGSLFQESSDDLYELRRLENMIKKPLESFRLEKDWLAEDSFAKETETAKRPMAAQAEDYLPLCRKRPLFLYREMGCLALEDLRGSRFGDFQERTMDKWWKSQRPNLSRDYYQLFHEETLLWVYRDQGGTWHTHGVYG